MIELVADLAPAATLAPAAIVVVLAYAVFGLTGFGASIIAVPLLAHLFSLRFVVPMMLMFDLCTGLLMAVRNRREVDRRELLRLLPFMLVGMAAGVTLLVRAPERWLLGVLGGFVLAHAAWNLAWRRAPAPISPAWSAPAGAVGGAFTALYGTGGPVYTLYLARRLFDKSVLRATIATLIFASALVRLALFTGSGLYAQPGLLAAGAVLTPAAIAGMHLGSRLHARLPMQHVVRFVWAVLIAGGASLLWRGIGG